MSRKTITGLVLVALCLLAGVGLLVFYQRTDVGDSVYMPGIAAESMTTQPDTSDENRKKLEQVNIDKSNVLAALATLSRPEEYQLEATLTYYYSKGGLTESQVFSVTTMVQPGRSKTLLSSVHSGSRTNVHTLLTGDRSYIWEDGSSTVYEGNAGDIGSDDIAHMPTYEDLLSLSPGSITDGFIDSSSDCVVVESIEGDTGYTQRWFVSIREGLLMEYICSDGDQLVFTALVLEARSGGEGMSEQAFALPDGTVPG